MGIRLHSDQSLVLVLRGQDHFVFIHLLDGVGGADDGYLTTDAEPVRKNWSFQQDSNAAGQAPSKLRQGPFVPTADFVTFTLEKHLQKSAPGPRAGLWVHWVAYAPTPSPMLQKPLAGNLQVIKTFQVIESLR